MGYGWFKLSLSKVQENELIVNGFLPDITHILP
jgi:hypothetical protein